MALILYFNDACDQYKQNELTVSIIHHLFLTQQSNKCNSLRTDAQKHKGILREAKVIQNRYRAQNLRRSRQPPEPVLNNN